MEGAKEDVLAHMHVPAPRRDKPHPTNPIARLSGAIKPRTDALGIVPSDPAP